AQSRGVEVRVRHPPRQLGCVRRGPLELLMNYVSIVEADRRLNAAIVAADISEGYEAHLEIFERFYDDEVEVSTEQIERPVTGKAAVRSRIRHFLVVLHVLAEIGGLKVSIRAEPIASDAGGETHSLWTLELRGVTGTRTVLKWRARRRWRNGR